MEARQARAIPFQDLQWIETTIPGSSPPIEMGRFPAKDPTGASSALVRFPRGWSRPGSGYYPVHEEILVVEGDLTVTGITYLPGDYAWLPAGYLRSASASTGGALALARFSGPPAWTPSDDPGEAYRPEAAVRRRWSDAVEHPSPLGNGRARLLREDASLCSWILEHDEATDIAPQATELFSLKDHSWAWIDPGQGLPRMERPCFCRTFHDAR